MAACWCAPPRRAGCTSSGWTRRACSRPLRTRWWGANALRTGPAMLGCTNTMMPATPRLASTGQTAEPARGRVYHGEPATRPRAGAPRAGQGQAHRRGAGGAKARWGGGSVGGRTRAGGGVDRAAAAGRQRARGPQAHLAHAAHQVRMHQDAATGRCPSPLTHWAVYLGWFHPACTQRPIGGRGRSARPAGRRGRPADGGDHGHPGGRSGVFGGGRHGRARPRHYSRHAYGARRRPLGHLIWPIIAAQVCR